MRLKQYSSVVTCTASSNMAFDVLCESCCGPLTYLSHEVCMVHESVVILLHQDVIVCQKLGMLLPQLFKIGVLTAWTSQLAL